MVPLPRGLSARTGWTLQTEGLAIRHRENAILTGLDWAHRPGEIAWILGENGAGKSSLLRVLAGRARAAAGRVLRRGPGGQSGEVLYYHPGMGLPDRATVREWRRLVAALARGCTTRPVPPGLPPAQPAAGQRLDRLSTGEARRLLLAALLERDAPFLLLDEPFEHLAEDARRALAEALVERAREAVVVVATNQPVPEGADRGPRLCLQGQGRFYLSEEVAR